MPGRKRRLVRYGGTFTSGDLDRGDVELELPGPSPEPAQEPSESWARLSEHRDKHARAGLLDRARAYREAHRGPH